MASLFNTPKITMNVTADQYGASKFENYQNAYAKKKVGLNFYKTAVDKASGVFKASVRFLPPHPDCPDLGYITTQIHNYTVVGKYNEITKKTSKRFYSDVCTKKQFGEPCPVCDYIYEDSRYKNFSPLEKRMFPDVRYVANILVLKDWNNPANDGKVFLWEFGRFVAKMIENAINGTFDGEDGEKIPSQNPFDPENGSAFLISYYLEQNSILKTERCKWNNVKKFPIGSIKPEEQIVSEMVPLNKLIVNKDEVPSYDVLKQNWERTIYGKTEKKDTNESVAVENKEFSSQVSTTVSKTVTMDDDDDFDPKPSFVSGKKADEDVFGDDDGFLGRMED